MCLNILSGRFFILFPVEKRMRWEKLLHLAGDLSTNIFDLTQHNTTYEQLQTQFSAHDL